MKTIIEILVDNSNSMGLFEVEKNNGEYLLPDGSTRMNLARRILKDELIPNLDYASKIIVRKFHSTNPIDQPTVLQIDTIYNTALDIENLKQIIDEIPDPKNTGGTPITSAVKYSIDNLRNFPDWDRKIILVTDGQETEEGDYRKAAKEAMSLYGIPCSVFIIGIQQSEEAEQKSRELAADTGGEYMNLKVAQYDKTTIQSKLSQIKGKILNRSVENRVNPLSYTNPTIQTERPNQQITPEAELSVNEPSNEPIPILNNENLLLDFKVNTTSENELKSSEINQENKETNYRLNIIQESIKSNAEVLGLINKQIASIQNELGEIKSSKSDYEENDEIVVRENQEEQDRVGRKSEKYLFELLTKKYGERLIWLNKEGEQGGDHDFEVIDFDKSVDFYIECKGTKTHNNIIYLTNNEWSFFLKNTKNYQVYFIKNIDKAPELIKIDNLMDWILNEKVVPYSDKNQILKKNRILMMIK